MSKLTNNTTSLEQILEDLKTKATPSGGTNTSDATAVAGDILSGKTAYVKGEKITGTIETKTSSNLTASGATVIVPAGYYAINATKKISTGKATTPATTITATPTISIDSTGKITASASTSKSITPTITAGYVSSGTAGTVTVSGSNTKQLTTKAATTYIPTTSNQTIAASTYLTGVQTIKGDSNLVASNIKSGISIFGVTGSYVGEGGEGGGSSGESCLIEFVALGPFMGHIQAYFIDEQLQSQTKEVRTGSSITCLKNSIVYLTGTSSMTSFSGGIKNLQYALGTHTIRVTGNGSVMLET